VSRTIPPCQTSLCRLENVEGSRAGHRILRLKGPLTLSHLFQFQALVRAEKAPVTIIDLTNVPYIDSAGIGSLMGAHVSRQKDGYSLALAGVNKRVKDALEVTRVFQFFRVYPSVAEAESALSHA
jgi:anti-sigma B factor antagonist